MSAGVQGSIFDLDAESPRLRDLGSHVERRVLTNGAWVDLRDGPTFGAVFTAELDPSRAVFVPRGVGNSFQTLEPHAAYTYLVNDHWSADARYTFLNLADETVNVPWPIALSEAILSDKDKAHPRLAEVNPFPAPGAEA